MKNFIPFLVCVFLLSSCQQSKEDAVNDLLKAENSFDKEKVSQLLSDSFIYYGTVDTLNKDEYLSWLDSTLRPLECKTSILNIQDLDSIVKTEEQVRSCIDVSLDVTPPYVRKMTYRFFNDKLISITVDSTNYEEYVKSYNEKCNPFVFYIKDKYGKEDWNEIAPNLKKYLSEYTVLSVSEKKQYETYAYLQGTYVSKDCVFYKKLIFRGKRTVTIIDAIFGFPFSTSYELDEDIVRIRTDKSDLLFDIKDSQTLIGEGFANGTFIKVN